jgi:hypothetical protein
MCMDSGMWGGKLLNEVPGQEKKLREYEAD